MGKPNYSSSMHKSFTLPETISSRFGGGVTVYPTPVTPKKPKKERKK